MFGWLQKVCFNVYGAQSGVVKGHGANPFVVSPPTPSQKDTNAETYTDKNINTDTNTNKYIDTNTDTNIDRNTDTNTYPEAKSS